MILVLNSILLFLIFFLSLYFFLLLIHSFKSSSLVLSGPAQLRPPVRDHPQSTRWVGVVTKALPGGRSLGGRGNILIFLSKFIFLFCIIGIIFPEWIPIFFRLCNPLVLVNLKGCQKHIFERYFLV